VRRLSFSLVALALSSCAGQRPALPPGAAVSVPADWRVAGAPTHGIEARWWRRFGDPALDALVERGLVKNADLMIAGARIAEARAAFRLAASRARPSLGLSLGGGYGRSVNAFGEGLDQTQASGQLSLAYEVDLFGRLSAATDARRQAYLATAFARGATRIALTSTIVTGYLGLRALDEKLRIATDTVNSRGGELAVLRRRSAAGYSSQLDLRQAEAEYEAARRLIPATRLSVARQEGALSVLVGDPPGDVSRGGDLDRLGAIEVPHSLPAEVLRQRPDVAEAEARIVSADRDLDSARAAFMPRVQLTPSGGGVASSVLTNPISLFSIGGSILAPLFQGGALRADADAAAARRDQAAFAYRRTVLTAFQEVEDALAGVELVGDEQDAAARQVTAVGVAAALSRRRYRAGYSSYLDQLDSERSLLGAQLQLVDLRLNRLTMVVAVYRSLGGGWQPLAAPPR
jgi:multidrug efflux system outer membrane protein